VVAYPAQPAQSLESHWVSWYSHWRLHCCKVHFGCVCNMQPVHDEMPVVIKIIAQLLYDNNLRINNYIFLCPHGC